MIVVPGPSAGTVRKRAVSPSDRDRLAQEAAVLRVARHPGVVELVAASPGAEALVLRSVTGGSLAGLGSVSPERAVTLGAAIATVVADLHDLGVVHGDLDPTHVLFDEAGAPVLCSLGRGSLVGRLGPGASQDVFALAALLRSVMDPAAAIPVPLQRILARASDRRPSRRPTARALSLTLAGLAPGVSDGATATGPSRLIGVAATARGPSRRIAVAAAGVAVVAALAGARWGGSTLVAVRASGAAAGGGTSRAAPRARPAVPSAQAGPGQPTPRAAPRARPGIPRALGEGRPASTPPCPAPDAGCEPLPNEDGTVLTPAGRFRVGRPGDLVVLGRWRCSPAPHLALLRPSTSEVWVFDGWADPARPVPGRLVATVAGTVSLRVVPTTTGCDQLMVMRDSGPPVAVPIPAP